MMLTHYHLPLPSVSFPFLILYSWLLNISSPSSLLPLYPTTFISSSAIVWVLTTFIYFSHVPYLSYLPPILTLTMCGVDFNSSAQSASSVLPFFVLPFLTNPPCPYLFHILSLASTLSSLHFHPLKLMKLFFSLPSLITLI